MAAPDPTSRYANLPEIRVVAPDGSVRVLGAPRAVPAPPTRGSYTVRAGDRLDLLASTEGTQEADLGRSSPVTSSRSMPVPNTRAGTATRRSPWSFPIRHGPSWWLLADANPFADATRLERPGATIDLPDA